MALGKLSAVIKKFLNFRFLFFLLLALILGLLVGLRFLKKPKPTPPLPTPLPTPSPEVLASPVPAFGDPTFFQEMDEVNENFYPLLKYLPYQTQEFVIKYTDPLELEITLIGPDPKIARGKALEWLVSIGADLERHKLIFTTP